MSDTNAMPFGAKEAILNYGEVLKKLNESKINKSSNYNSLFNKEIVKQIHKHISSFFGEESIIREQGTFEDLCKEPFQSFGGQDLYPTVYDKAAKIMEGFATHQVFFEGNKRLAVGATLQYLKSQNIKITLDQQSLYDLIIEIEKTGDNCKFGTMEKEVLVGDNLVLEKIANIANVIRENSMQIENDKTINYAPVGSAKNFNKEEYDDVKNSLDHGSQDFTEEYEKE